MFLQKNIQARERNEINLIKFKNSYEENVATSKEGNYSNSKFHNSGAMHFNPPRSKRFPGENKGEAKPGPGQYDCNTGL